MVNGVMAGSMRGWLMDDTGLFAPDRAGEATLPVDGLRALASDAQPLTFMCVPWGSGVRIALDRDLDGVLNGDE